MNVLLRYLLAVLLAVLYVGDAVAKDVRVKGYYRKNGTYVAPHYRSSPNSTKSDNWSTRGNVNPYTGEPGTKSPYGSSNSTYGGSTYTAPGSTNGATSSPRSPIEETNAYIVKDSEPRRPVATSGSAGSGSIGTSIVPRSNDPFEIHGQKSAAQTAAASQGQATSPVDREATLANVDSHATDDSSTQRSESSERRHLTITKPQSVPQQAIVRSTASPKSTGDFSGAVMLLLGSVGGIAVYLFMREGSAS